ncbi:MAG: CinA family protein [Chloroflexi bacterium]|nr:CinA family protein [Chloroflexota bacterium]MYK61096.1 CinA family protein [Chloroflexota bacterium]
MNELGNRAQAVATLLKDAGQTIGVSESSGGGLISACLLAVPGASAYLIGGAVTYTRTSHKAFLRVPDEALTGIRSSTEEYASLNARSVREALGTIWGLAETGASGPTGNRYGDAAGHTCVAVSGPIERYITLETGESDREANMWAFVDAAFGLLEECLNEAE